MKGNNQIKRIALVIVLVLLFQYIMVLVPFIEVNAEKSIITDENGIEITWTYVLKEGKATQVKISDTSTWPLDKVEIPSALDGYEVISIGDNAFENISMEELVIPSSIVSIDKSAFSHEYCYINSKITVDADNKNYMSVGSILFNKDKTELIKCPGFAVQNNYKIPEGVTSIGEYAFSNCTKLTGVTMPEGIVSIAKNAFYNCNNLTSINIPSSVTSIGDRVFYNCNLTSIDIPSNITSIGDSTFTGCNNLASINIPEGVTSIGSSAFEWCSSLTSIEIPDKVTKIGNNAFYGCNKLTDINIPEGVTSIENYTFYDCSSLTEITIPNKVTNIGNYAFYNCNNLTSINIPEGVTNIGDYAFSGCTKLTNIEIPNSVTSIGSMAFQNCSGLTKIEIPNSVTSIGNYAFENCDGLTSMEIPSSVTSIGDVPFKGCKNLTSINVDEANKEYISIDGVLFGDKGKSLISYPQNKEGTKYKVPDGVKTIGNYAFYNCRSLTDIVIPNSVTSIENGAFSGCSKLTNIVIPSSVTSIGDSVFSECYNFVIVCENNSTAYTYAQNNNRAYKLILKVKFSDEKLYNKIKEVASEFIVSEDSSNLEMKIIEDISSLDISNADIESIDELENFKYLTTLNASNNKISNIEVLESLENLESINLKNQTIEVDILKKESELVDILKKATDSKYNNGENVTFTTENCSVENGKVIIDDNFSTGTITVNNGAMSGTVCNIKLAEGVSVKYDANGNLKLTPYNNNKILNIEDIELYYSIDDGEYQEYTGPVILTEGKHNLKVKFFGKEILNEEIEVKIPVGAIRRDGKIYIYSGSSDEIKYSLTGNDFTTYVGGIDNTESKTIFAKIGENEVKEVEIKEVDDSEIFDIQINSEQEKAMRSNGVIKIEYKGQNFNYSFDKENWTRVYDSVTINNIEAESIYIWKEHNVNGITVKDDNFFEVKIRDVGQVKEELGIYNKDGKSYIFGEEVKYYENKYQNSGENFYRTQYTVIDDENKMQLFSNDEILDVTKIAGDVFVLKNDGIVYKMGNSYEDLETITGGIKFRQLDGVYAIDNENNIWKCEYNYDDNTYSYTKCDYSLEDEVVELSSVVVENSYCPYVLYSNGKAVILKGDGTTKEIANNVIDISAKGVDYFALQYDAVIYNDKIVELVNKGIFPIKINNQGSILTSDGNYYELNIEYNYKGDIASLSYGEKSNKANIEKLGNYTYQNKDGSIYYIENDEKVEKKIDNITVTKDESKLSQNKVEIKIEVPENTYTIKMPDGNTTLESSLTYEVTENGQYVFEFTDSTGYSVIRVVHVTNIQNRKETKVPEVTAVNGKIKLESDSKIEYSLDNKKWEEYTKEIEYKEPIYTRIKDDNYECSILKIKMNENGSLEVENTEEREIQGEILTNGIGTDGSEDNIKIIEYEKAVEEETKEENNTKKNFFDYISEIADNIIYSFSSTDGKYAGCYFEDNNSEITYKDINENIVDIIDDDVTSDNMVDGNKFIDYGVILKGYSEISGTEEEEKQKVENGQIYKYEKVEESEENQTIWKETTIEYAYIDIEGNLISNIDIINKVKEELEEKTKYTKIVGDGMTFYILTEEGEVYIATKGDNGTFDYLSEKTGLNKIMYKDDRYHYIISKLDLKNIVNIYDSCTALTKDGEVVSLIEDNEESTSAVQELQEQTDKYLVASHLGLKDGKLYNFANVKEGVEVTAGKIVKTQEGGFGVYSENDKTIELFKNEKQIPSLEEGESYIDVQATDEQLPEFIDIAEFRNSYLLMLVSYYYVGIYPYGETIESDYSDPDEYAKCYAVAKDGELWAYIGGYIVDTGINLDYFGPTINYTLNNTKWTNQNISLDFTENTTGEIISTKIRKGNDIIAEIKPVTIEKNGEYSIEITDSKGRSYTSILNVGNIDKVNPDVGYVGEIKDGVANIMAYDIEDLSGDYAKSGIAKIELTYETPTEDTEWITLEGELNENGKMTAQVEQIETTSYAYVRATDNAGNVSVVRKIEFKEEIKEPEPDEEPDMPKTGQSRALYWIIGIIITSCIGILICIEISKKRQKIK